MSALRFEHAAPTSLPEAIRLLSEAAGEVHVLAGGTDLLLKLRNAAVARADRREPLLVGLKRIPELSRLTWDPEIGLTIGATTRLADVAGHEAVRRHYPAIAHAASQTGTPQIRNMGTVVGNICNAAPSADNVPALLVLGAYLLVEGPAGRRDLPFADFFRGPGQTTLLPGEIVTAVVVPPPPPRSGAAYLALSARGRVDISSVGVAVMVVLDEQGVCGSARISLGAVAPTPLRVCDAEQALVGRMIEGPAVADACSLSSAEACPITDARASDDYRRKMVRVLVGRALTQARDRARANALSDESGETPAGGRKAL